MRKATLCSLLAALLMAAILSLAGCGGSSGSSGGVGGNTGQVALFATDSMDANDHVWVTVYKIDLNSSSGSQTVFEDSNGVEIDLRSLRDSQGAKFGFLGVGKVSGGPFQSASVTLAKELTIFPAGSTSGVKRVFANSLDAGLGKSKLILAFSNPLPLGQSDRELVIDFDLANWNDVNGLITPVLKEHNGNGLNDDRRHVEYEHEGTISAISGTSPTQEFDLVTGGGRSIHIRTNADTVVYSNGSKNNPTLANGARVHVRGRFKVASNVLLATAIKVQNDGSNDNSDEAKGDVLNIDANGKKFDLTISSARGFVPNATTIHVVTSASTTYRGFRGSRLTATEFFSALRSGAMVEAEGTYDESTKTLTAFRVKFEDDDNNGNGNGGFDDLEARGRVSNLNAAAGTFTVTLSEWEGFSGSVGMTLNVTTSGSTVFFNKERDKVSKGEFFAELDQFGFVEVEGSLNGSTFVAKKAKVEDD